jgi:hypothetical protein
LKIELLSALKQPRVSEHDSNAQIAASVFATLGNVIVEDTVERKGDSVLTLEQQTATSDMTEAEVIRFLTPFLYRALGLDHVSTDPCARVLVDSQSHAWLDNARTPLAPCFYTKPDMFMTYRPFFTVANNTPRESSSGVEFVAGSLTNRSLQLAQCANDLFEGKKNKNFDNAAFGELVTYHRRTLGSCRGMLFCGNKFWLYRTYDGNPQALIKCTWASPGSFDLVRGFFASQPPPLVVVMRTLLSQLGMRAEEGAFLGAGGAGRVFRVVSSAAQDGRRVPPCALKVQIGSESAQLVDEFEKLVTAATRGATVVTVAPNSLKLVEDEQGVVIGGGYLMVQVGSAFVVSSQHRCERAFKALQQLHECGVYHGDARLPNLILHGDDLLWVDMRASTFHEGETVPIMSKLDALSLVRSVLAGREPPPNVVSAAAAYSMTRTADDVVILANAVWSATAGVTVDAVAGK